MTDVSCIVEGDGDRDSKIRDGQQLKNDDVGDGDGDGGNLNSRSTTPVEETKPLSITTTMKAMTAMMTNEPNPPKTLAPFNPSSQQIIDMALDILDLKPNDVVFDIGCGDGRFLIEAVRHYEGLRCVGIEIDEVFVERARQTIATDLPPQGRSRIEIRHEDALQLLVDGVGGGGGDLCENDKNFETTTSATKQISELSLLDDATVLYLFVLPKGIVKLTPLLIEMVERRRKNRSCSSKSNSLRILSYMFKLHDWEPTKVDKTAKGGLPVYYYEL